MKTITILVGLPRSGKSTWVKKHKTENEVKVSADDIRTKLYGHNFFENGENFVWGVHNIMLNILMSQDTSIIIDNTNTMAKRRAPFMKLAEKYGYSVNCMVFDTPVDECIKRAEATGREDLIPIIGRMLKQFEEPTIEEGFDQITHVGEMS